MEPICPACKDPDVEVLTQSINRTKLRCTECGHIWTENPKQGRELELHLIVSADDQSHDERIPVLSTDHIEVGAEFEHNGHRMLVTAIENTENRKVESAPTTQVKVVHAKMFDTVPLKISVNELDITRSYRLDVDPDEAIYVGSVLEVDDRRLAVKTLKSDQNRTLHKGFLLARNVRRVFCDPAPDRARPGQRVYTRRRGKPAGAKPDARHRRR